MQNMPKAGRIEQSGQSAGNEIAAGYTPFRPSGHRLAREVLLMKSGYITFRSVTLAQKGEGAVRRAGMECTLQRTPRWMEEQGCGYCLRLRERDVQPAVLLLRENEISFRRLYISRENGKMEEVRL